MYRHIWPAFSYALWRSLAKRGLVYSDPWEFLK